MTRQGALLRRGLGAWAAVWALGSALQAQDSGPLSTIDWLSESLAEEAALRPERRAPPQALGSAAPAPVTVRPLDAVAPEGVGSIAPERIGLPPDFWGPARTDEIAAAIADLPTAPLPAARDAIRTLLLTRFDPPAGGGPPNVLTLARIDALLRIGALDEAAGLIAATGENRPELFRRDFDIALLQEREEAGCARLKNAPGIAPSLSVRIFCLARSGDWAAAALTLETASTLGQLSPLQDALLARFLDPELADGAAPLPRFPAPTPLEWRMLEAIGERQPTAALPVAFAHADLRETAGWRARMQATERLVRAGALPSERLLDVYRERTPAASGGVWDRARAVQSLDDALARGRPAEISRRLTAAWAGMRRAGLAVPFAEAITPDLAGLSLGGDSARLATRIGLLSSAYEETALAAAAAGRTDADPLALAFARGLPADPPRPATGPLAAALAQAFATPPPPAPLELTALRENGRLGEAVLDALALLAEGARRDPDDLTGALVFLRAVGFEDTARRAALQLYLLEGGA